MPKKGHDRLEAHEAPIQFGVAKEVEKIKTAHEFVTILPFTKH